jgi:urea transport system substrate-binding protein
MRKIIIPCLASAVLLVGSIGFAQTNSGAPDLAAKTEQAAQAFKSGDYARANALFREVTVLNPQNATAWYFLGQSLERTGDVSGARSAYEKSLQIAPAGVTAERSRGALSKLGSSNSGAVSSSDRPTSDAIKVGILHSLSGAMANSETALKDTALMAIEEINAKGGLLGRKIEVVVVDPASNWPRFAEKARQLLAQDKVAVVFGCWTSISRKTVLPVFKELNGLLFYPVQYEGEELERNVFYTGAVPNQQAIPATEYLMSNAGGGAKRWVLIGTDFVYPRTTNKILRGFLNSKGVSDSDIYEVYSSFGQREYQSIVGNVKRLMAGGKTAVISTINGDSNIYFYRELANVGLNSSDLPVVALSLGEGELRGSDPQSLSLVGQLAGWNYFQSIRNPSNMGFVTRFKAYASKMNLPNASTAVTNDPMEATYIGVNMWAQAVAKANTTDVDKVIEAMGGMTFQAPSGYVIEMDRTNHHLHKPMFIGDVKADGQFNIRWKANGLIRAQPWSPFIAGNEGKQEF